MPATIVATTVAALAAALPSNNLTCEPLPQATEVPDLFLLGQGLCVDAHGLTPQAFVCNATAQPDACAAVSTNATACAAQCQLDDGCTGFELRADPTSGVLQCFVIFNTVPAVPLLPWVVGDNGTQLASRTTVVATDGSALACCYRRSYPRPLPRDMPILKPPQQTSRDKEVFASLQAQAALASTAVLPALTAFIDYCAANATDGAGQPYNLFGTTNCPGLADLTANGTLAPYPTGAQVVQRFLDEVRAMEVGHGFQPLWDTSWGCVPDPCITDPTLVLDPLLPILPNLYIPQTLGWNMTLTSTAYRFTPVMETVFRLDPFVNHQTYTLNFTDAASRITYCASNYCRGPVGNVIGSVGSWDAILRPSYIRDMVLITPADSWHCESWCVRAFHSHAAGLVTL
jgi:hypothetical protein